MVTLFADTDSYGNTPYSITYNHANRQFVPAGRWGHGIFAKRKLPAALPHKLDFCFIQDPVCSMPSNPILKAMVIKTANVHTHYWDFVADDGSRLVTVAGQESARAMEE
jgi:hypothetical protein